MAPILPHFQVRHDLSHGAGDLSDLAADLEVKLRREDGLPISAAPPVRSMVEKNRGRIFGATLTGGRGLCNWRRAEEAGMALLDTACLIAGMLRGTRSRCAVMRSMVALRHIVNCISLDRAMVFGS